jgi:hypothetical protein
MELGKPRGPKRRKSTYLLSLLGRLSQSLTEQSNLDSVGDNRKLGLG